MIWYLRLFVGCICDRETMVVLFRLLRAALLSGMLFEALTFNLWRLHH